MFFTAPFLFLTVLFFFVFIRKRKHYVKSRTFSEIAFNGYAAAVKFNDTACYRKSETCSLRGTAASLINLVETFENERNILFCNTLARILDGKAGAVIHLRSRNGYRSALGGELYCIVDKDDEQLTYAVNVAPNGTQFTACVAHKRDIFLIRYDTHL